MTRSRSWRNTLCTGVLLVGAVCRATTTHAQAEPDGYRAAIDGAVLEFAARHFEESRSLFARAHAVFPNARTLRGLGMAEFELRNYRECTRQLEAALQSNARPLDDALRTDTEELLRRAKQFLGRYVVQTKPEVRDVVIDGVANSLPPDHALLLNAGDHLLELQAQGYAPEKRLLSVRGGEDETLGIVFKKAWVGADGARPSEPSRWYQHSLPWVIVGVVVLGGAAAAVLVATSSHGPERAPVNGGTSGVVIGGL